MTRSRERAIDEQLSELRDASPVTFRDIEQVLPALSALAALEGRAPSPPPAGPAPVAPAATNAPRTNQIARDTGKAGAGSSTTAPPPRTTPGRANRKRA